MKENSLEIIELTSDSIKSMIYEIRGQKVMLDFDLARIYGYTTKAFNQQIKNNIERFPEDFMFQLNEIESEQLARSKILTSQMWTIGNKGGRTSLPYAFTENGIYMLASVLKGELAVKQSIALIRLFKQMKDYIVSTNGLTNANELIKLTNQVNKHDKDIKSIKTKLNKVIDNFIDPSTYKHFLILNGEKIEADIAYQQIYALAHDSIYIVDDYINERTLQLLRHVSGGIKITIFTDNIAKEFIKDEDLEKYREEYGLIISLKPTKNTFHDRYIMIDYKSKNEQLFHAGASSKDAGHKVMTITKIEESNAYHNLFDYLLENKE